MENKPIAKVYILATISGGQRYVSKAFTNYLFACDYIEDTVKYWQEQGYNVHETQRIIDPFTAATTEPEIIEVHRLRRGADICVLELYSVEPWRDEDKPGTPQK